jgi:hypothetical protein
MKNPLDSLYATHQEADELWQQTDNMEAKDILTPTICVTRNLIYRLEAGETIMFPEIEEVIAIARSRIDSAYKLIDAIADTLRSGELTLSDEI